MKKFLRRFHIFELMLIAMMAALGIAVKPYIKVVVQIVAGPLFIPGGALAGGLYLIWIVIGAGLIKKPGTATLIALTQGIMVMITGIYGSHGVMSIVTYTMPGLMMDLLFGITKSQGTSAWACFLGGIVANLTGTFLSNLLFFNLPLIPLILTLSTATLSGGLGGILAYQVIKSIKKLGNIQNA
ncbi:ECF transporter S component [Vallitalea pronyensis]|uniref:ECF transporter S component n=1 Tax=Vallitalea pronyensis TaxID=1348613 RepID=A0A8J8SGW5_9FIRM|nr:ECF transporter S component [Vallitalea pronyensis]QUI22797.1 ECF transporter S component [Vallitalea pronyensis]